MPEFANQPAEACLWAVVEWHRHALPVIGTKDFEITWAEFVYCWDKVNLPAGWAMLSAALERAKLDLPERYAAPKLRLLHGVCRELQRSVGQAPFFLACRSAGKLIGADHDSASVLIRLLVHDGLLQVSIAGTTKRATRYRYLGP